MTELIVIICIIEDNASSFSNFYKADNKYVQSENFIINRFPVLGDNAIFV